MIMYTLVWTPNFCGEPFQLETFHDHDDMSARLKEIHEAKYEDVNWRLYCNMVDDEDIIQEDLKKILAYHKEVSAMEIYINPDWYGGRNYKEENIKLARLGKILLKYIDRLNDPVETADVNGYTDTTINIVKEMSNDFNEEMKLQYGDDW